MSKEKLIALSKEHNKKSTWLKGALERRKNNKWLNYSSEIAKRILAKIEENGLSQADLAVKLKVSPQQISKIVKGYENLTLETIGKFSDALEFELITFPSYKYNYSDQALNEITWIDTTLNKSVFQTWEMAMPVEFIRWSDIKVDNIINAPLENAVSSVEQKKEDPSNLYLKAA